MIQCALKKEPLQLQCAEGVGGRVGSQQEFRDDYNNPGEAMLAPTSKGILVTLKRSRKTLQE